MQQESYQWKGLNGKELYGREWIVDNPKAVVLLVHGMGEHCERYQPLAEFLNKNQITLVSYDQRGHGQTAGKRGHSSSSTVLWEDLNIFRKKISEKYAHIPLFLYGHSMGGNVVLNYVLRYKPGIAGTIATGPWIKLAMEPPKALIAIGKMLRNILPGVQQDTKLDANHISTIKAEVEKYQQDSHVHGKISFAMAVDIMKDGVYLDQYSGEFPTPLLIMHGGDDPITSKIASKAFADRVSGNITFKEWAGSFHEIHNDVDRKGVFDAVLEFLNDNI